MKGKIIRVSPKKPEREFIERAAKIIKRGGLVAFPTETVYGLGANALNKKAVKKIFQVKKRPLDNPVIVHIAEIKDLFKLAKNIPKEAEILIKKFWPGPLTLVLFKKEIVPNEVTAGSNTLAIRMPKNKIALELIKTSGTPIAAPSANLAGRPSPIEARTVFEDLGQRVDLILDGGKTKIGLESTVIDLTTKPFQILRPGGISFEKLKKILKNVELHPFLRGEKLQDKIVKSPGMKYRHYAPKAPLILVEGKIGEMVKKIKDLIPIYQKKTKKVGVMAAKETKNYYQKADLVLNLGSRKNLEEVARNLFSTLRQFDEKGIDIILAESFPEKGIGLAISHRLKKAAKKII